MKEGAFCDGIRLEALHIPKAVAVKSEHVLKGELNAGLPGLIIQNLCFTQHDQRCFIWITLTPETAKLTPQFLQDTKIVRDLVKKYAE